MDIPVINPSELCGYCAIFATDHQENYGPSASCFNRTDSSPHFPALTMSGKGGCKVCVLFKKALSSKIQEWRRNDLVRVEELKTKVNLSGRFQFFEEGKSLQSSLAVAIKIIANGVGLDTGEKLEATLKICRTTHDPGNINPPIMYSSIGQTLSPDNKRIMHKWLAECNTKHITCMENSIANRKSHFLPTRLIRITPGQARLVETQRLAKAKTQATRYMALSHCWGSRIDTKYKTTKENLQARLLEMSATELPQNIKDAFLVGQSLGIEYIWIDSICIVQDWPEDLEAEIRVMLEVYANSYLAISATCAASVEEGFLDRPSAFKPSLVIRRQTVLKPAHDSNDINVFPDEDESEQYLSHLWTSQIRESPWNKRAWTLQESLVSPKIIHFAKDRMFFECAELDCFDGGDYSREVFNNQQNDAVTIMDRYRSVSFIRQHHTLQHANRESEGAKLDKIKKTKSLFRTIKNNLKRKTRQLQGIHSLHEEATYDELESIFQGFCLVVRNYSGRKLGFIEDKAIAFSSILTATTRLTGSPARHGLLMNDLRRSLYWRPESRRNVNPPLKQWPTWSWLSYHGRVKFIYNGAAKPSEEKAISQYGIGREAVRDSKAQDLQSTDMFSKKLCLQGFLIKPSSFKMISTESRILINIRGQEVGTMFFDSKSMIFSSPPVHLFCLGISNSGAKRLDFQGLMLLPNDDDGTFKRIGTFSLSDGSKPDYHGKDRLPNGNWIWDNVPRTRVTLV